MSKLDTECLLSSTGKCKIPIHIRTSSQAKVLCDITMLNLCLWYRATATQSTKLRKRYLCWPIFFIQDPGICWDMLTCNLKKLDCCISFVGRKIYHSGLRTIRHEQYFKIPSRINLWSYLLLLSAILAWKGTQRTSPSMRSTRKMSSWGNPLGYLEEWP